MNAPALGKRELQRIGTLVARHYPDIVQELTATYLTPEPTETDLTRIPALFQQFCEIRNIHPAECTREVYGTGRRPDKDKYPRKLFTSVVLHLFKPEILNQPLDSIYVIGGLVTALQTVLKYRNHASISIMIREAVAHERTYEDYRNEVGFIVEQLKGKGV